MKHILERACYEFIRLWKGGAAAARFLGVKVGQDCRMITRLYGTEPWLISIGDRVTVAHGVAFLTHDGSTSLVRDDRGRRYRYAPIEIGSDVFIGLNAVLLPGVRIGSRVIIGAGSVVTRSIPDGVIVAGNPVRVIGLFDDYERTGLERLPVAENMHGARYRERVESVAETRFRPLIASSFGNGKGV